MEDQETVEVGGEGAISVRFDAKDRYGMQRKKVTVTLEADGENETHTLELKVDVPRFVTFTPRVLNWKVGGALEERVVTVSFHEDVDIDIGALRVDSQDDSLFNVEMSREGERSLRVVFRPEHLERIQRERFFLAGADGFEATLRKHPIYGMIR